jgi:hypothetical protein
MSEPRRWNLGAKLALVALPFMLLSLLAIAATLWVSWQLEGGAAPVNEAGRMRMQTYRLSLSLATQSMIGTIARLRSAGLRATYDERQLDPEATLGRLTREAACRRSATTCRNTSAGTRSGMSAGCNWLARASVDLLQTGLRPVPAPGRRLLAVVFVSGHSSCRGLNSRSCGREGLWTTRSCPWQSSVRVTGPPSIPGIH